MANPSKRAAVVIELAGEPRAKGRPRFGRGHTYTPQPTRNYENDLRFMAVKAMSGNPPMEGPLSVGIVAAFGVPKSWSKAKQASALLGALRPTGRPDIDNCMKIIDALNGIVWIDDAQVVNATIKKVYSDRPRLWIGVEALLQGGA